MYTLAHACTHTHTQTILQASLSWADVSQCMYSEYLSAPGETLPPPPHSPPLEMGKGGCCEEEVLCRRPTQRYGPYSSVETFVQISGQIPQMMLAFLLL